MKSPEILLESNRGHKEKLVSKGMVVNPSRKFSINSAKLIQKVASAASVTME
jgi:hypothetical protein